MSGGSILTSKRITFEEFKRTNPEMLQRIKENEENGMRREFLDSGTLLRQAHAAESARKRADAESIRRNAETTHSSTPHQQRSFTDRTSALEAVQHKGSLLRFMPDRWRADRQIVLAAVDNDGHALRFASDALKADPDVVLSAVVRCGFALFDAGPKLRDDPVIVLTAVYYYGRSLRYASIRLQASREVVLVAVTNDGLALEHASADLRADPEVVGRALHQNGFALQFVAPRLLHDRRVTQCAVERNGEALQFATLEQLHDRDIVLAAVEERYNAGDLLGNALKFAPHVLQDDREVVLRAVRHNPEALDFCSERLYGDQGVHQAFSRVIQLDKEGPPTSPALVSLTVGQRFEGTKGQGGAKKSMSEDDNPRSSSLGDASPLIQSLEHCLEQVNLAASPAAGFVTDLVADAVLYAAPLLIMEPLASPDNSTKSIRTPLTFSSLKRRLSSQFNGRLETAESKGSLIQRMFTRRQRAAPIPRAKRKATHRKGRTTGGNEDDSDDDSFAADGDNHKASSLGARTLRKVQETTVEAARNVEDAISDTIHLVEEKLAPKGPGKSTSSSEEPLKWASDDELGFWATKVLVEEEEEDEPKADFELGEKLEAFINEAEDMVYSAYDAVNDAAGSVTRVVAPTQRPMPLPISRPRVRFEKSYSYSSNHVNERHERRHAREPPDTTPLDFLTGSAERK